MKHLHRPRLILLPIAASLLLTACAVTRTEAPAPAAPPAAFKEAQPAATPASAGVDGGSNWLPAAAQAPTTTPDDWWTLFKDPVLDDLQSRLVIGNENIRSAIAQVASARAAVEASRSALLPTLSAGLSGSRSGLAQRSTSNTVTTGQTIGKTVSLTTNSTWDTDLWGRLRMSSEASQNTFQATADDLAAARLSAQALLATTYFSMRAAEAQRELYQRSVTAYQRSLELTQARYQSGVVGSTDVLQAQTQLRSAQAQVNEANATRATYEHAIAVLLGIAPSELSIASNGLLPATLDVPVLLPSTLIERRPDIAAAQRRVASAYLQIGVAKAAYFPSLSLSASAGYTNTSLNQLISVPTLIWSLGTSITQSILDGGQRRLATEQARAAAEVAASTYRLTVITAFQEVEDNLVIADQLKQEAELQALAVDTARRNLELVTDQYRAGTVSYLDVVTAQTAALTSENTLISVRNRQLAAVNTLLKNIAGRWDPA